MNDQQRPTSTTLPERRALGFDAVRETIGMLSEGDAVYLATLGYEARRYEVVQVYRNGSVALRSPRGVPCSLDVQPSWRRVLITYNPPGRESHTRQVLSVELASRGEKSKAGSAFPGSETRSQPTEAECDDEVQTTANTTKARIEAIEKTRAHRKVHRRKAAS